MSYKRPIKPNPVAPNEKPQIISDYIAYYKKIAELARERGDFSDLNVKLPKAAAEAFLNDVGVLLNQTAKSSTASVITWY
jgi:hypothetical protein